MKKTKQHKMIMITAIIIIFFTAHTAMAQVPPSGKYNTTNYPEERVAIEALKAIDDSTIYLNDDYIAVGPEGKVSYGFEQWKKGLPTTPLLLNQ